MFIVPLRLQPLFNFVWLCKSFLKGQKRTQSLKPDSSTNSFYINNFNSKLFNSFVFKQLSFYKIKQLRSSKATYQTSQLSCFGRHIFFLK